MYGVGGGVVRGVWLFLAWVFWGGGRKYWTRSGSAAQRPQMTAEVFSLISSHACLEVDEIELNASAVILGL